MKRIKILALIIALLVLLGALAGCSSNMNDVLATVDGRPIYRWYYQIYLDKQRAFYQQLTGIDLTRPEYTNQYKEYKEARLEDLIGVAAALNKAEALGFGNLTAEQEAELDAEYERNYQEAIESYMQQYGTDESARRKAEQDYDNWLKQMNLTAERIRQDNRDNFVLDQYYASVTEYGEVTDEEIQKQYDELLNTQKTENEKDPTYLSKNSGGVLVYYPEGYVHVHLIEIPFGTQSASTVKSAGDAMSEAAIAAVNAISEGGEDSADAKAKQEALQKAMDAYNNSLEKGYKEIESTADGILSRLDAGESFDAVYADLFPNISPKDYYLCDKSDIVNAAIIAEAIKMTTPGEHTGAIKTDSGLCVAYLAEKVQARTVPIEEVRDAIAAEIQSSRTFSEATKIRLQCVAEAKEIVRYLDKL
ncbi:MAG: SurA N-terminal domain-containing protein [Bacillota bacterium]